MVNPCPVGSCREVVPCSVHDRRAWCGKVGGSRGFPVRVRLGVLERDGWRCQSCGLVDRSGRLLEVDHVVPVAFGGGDGEGNAVTLCVSCHRRKSAREAGLARHSRSTRLTSEVHPGVV